MSDIDQGAGAPAEGLKYNLQQLLRAMVDKGASDMHITSGSPPLLRGCPRAWRSWWSVRPRTPSR